jgi:pimeloyl-ACP methyl ester carboxylesterase
MATTFNDAATETVKVDGADFAYRVIGDAGGLPIVLLHHFTGVLDDWDPAVIDGLAQQRRVIIFDNRGVGRSTGKTPDSVEAMAKDAIAFIGALGLTQVDVVGFSLGGFIAQVIAQDRPDLVRRLILAGTGPAGGSRKSDFGAILRDAFQNAAAQKKHPKHFLFFSQTTTSQAAADSFLQRLQVRKDDRDPAASNDTTQAQSVAIVRWGKSEGANKAERNQPPCSRRQRRQRYHGADDQFGGAVSGVAQRRAQHLSGCRARRHLPISSGIHRAGAPILCKLTCGASSAHLCRFAIIVTCEESPAWSVIQRGSVGQECGDERRPGDRRIGLHR